MTKLAIKTEKKTIVPTKKAIVKSLKETPIIKAKKETKNTIKSIVKKVSHSEFLQIKESMKPKILTENFQSNTKFSINTNLLGKNAKQVREFIRVDLFKIVDLLAMKQKSNKLTTEIKESVVNSFKIHLFTYRKGMTIEKLSIDYINNLFVGQSERKINYDIFAKFIISYLKLK